MKISKIIFWRQDYDKKTIIIFDHNIIRLILYLILLSTFSTCRKPPVPEHRPYQKLLPPPPGQIYHNAYPDFDDTEDQVRADSIQHFEQLAGKNIGWAYFSNNWIPQEGGIRFPSREVEIIHNAGKTPFIRMMARSSFDEEQADPVYPMDLFLSGFYDDEIRAWARQAKQYDFPLLAEFGTEMNGFWFPWNGYWNGAGDKTGYGDPNLYDGPEKFRDVYRRIINICREEGANNITWFFHVNVEDDPQEPWNRMENYYPGDDYIDWIGVSVYGSLAYDEPWREFADLLSANWDEITGISPTGKPVAVLEFGVLENPAGGDKAAWISRALQSVQSGYVFSGKISAISYWNESWPEDNGQTVNLRIDSSPQELQAYRNGVAPSLFTGQLQFETHEALHEE